MLARRGWTGIQGNLLAPHHHHHHHRTPQPTTTALRASSDVQLCMYYMITP
jgi:uncharacterized protein YjlB